MHRRIKILFTLLLGITFTNVFPQGIVTTNDTLASCRGYILWQDKTKCQLMDKHGKTLYNFPGNLVAFNKNKQEIAAHVGGNLMIYNKELDVLARSKMYIDHDLVITPKNDILFYSVEYDSAGQYLIRYDVLLKSDSSGKTVTAWSSLQQREYLVKYMADTAMTFLFKIKKGEDTKQLLNRLANALTGFSSDETEREFLHMNAVSYIPENDYEKVIPAFKKGNLLLSFCSYNDSIVSFIAIADPESYRILWTYSDPAHRQIHTPTVLGNGHLLYYANSSCKKDHDSSYVAEIDPINKSISWYYTENFSDPKPRCAHGSCQRLPNGNTLISNISGYIYEVAPNKKIVWQWQTNDTKHLYRAYLYPEEQLNWLLK